MTKARTIVTAVTMMLTFAGATGADALESAGNLLEEKAFDGDRDFAGRGPGSDDGHDGGSLRGPGWRVLDNHWGADDPSREPGWG
jgi:hypothetical protein